MPREPEKPYSPPELVRYGSIEELTEGDGRGEQDFAGLGQKS